GHFDAAGPAPDLDAGQRLQLRLLERWRAQGETVGGWKLGMTSGQSRDAFGAGFRPFGFILNSRILESGGQISVQQIQHGGIENELCFIMGEPLGEAATRESAIAAVAGVAPAFEINQRRIQADAAPGLRIADDLANWGLVVGRPVAPPEAFGDLVVVLRRAGEEIARVSATNHIDDHYQTLATLACKLAAHGLALQPGDRIITGAFTRTPLAVGSYEGDFGPVIGRVAVEVQE
ncbi:MAG: fumarylacetoacetate hydrolase family protein, partial [Gammaproteobacteria bacterium]|nr:fumarylacetoacetate hydrolase family protein [Gammaproteobacteria bacterium]